MSEYIAASPPTDRYPYSLRELRIRPPRKRRTGLVIVAVACTSALCGGVAAFALLNSGPRPAEIHVASLHGDGSATAEAAFEAAELAESETATAEPQAGGPAAIESTRVKVVPISPESLVPVEPAPLGADDPRWSNDAPVRKDVAQERPAAALSAALGNADIAEDKADVVALEERMNPEQPASAYASEDEDEPIEPVRISAPSFATGDLVAAKSTKWVNMRASNDMSAEKLLVVPRDAEIRADPNCRHWCRVVHDGRLGYVYRTFIRFPGETEVASKKAETP